MEDLMRRASELQEAIASACEKLQIDALETQKLELDERTAAPDFWQNPTAAQDIVRHQAKLAARIAPWAAIKKDISDVTELTAMQDAAMHDDLETQQRDISQRFDALKEELKFSGPYDDHDAILSIYAGAGGTDAQDWAQMVERMYLRWAEQHKYHVQVIDESAGDEAGIKSVTLEISGDFVYGKLKGEHGVHRLVRLSPFNSDSLRQTSFAKVDVLPKIDRPEDLVIDDKDLRIDVYRSGGHGGQSVNTTDSAVRITHLPTGIAVAIQNERSQLQNKETAMTILRSKLIALQIEQHKDKISELKGPSAANEFGSQIRNYVLHPYKQVKDLRSGYETSEPEKVLEGNLDSLINAYLEHSLGD